MMMIAVWPTPLVSLTMPSPLAIPPRRNADVYAHNNPSVYTLANVGESEHDALITPSTPSYGATFPSSPTPNRPSARTLITNAVIKMACIFLVSSALLGGILYLALPTLQE
jgi:hypothetical protein